MLLKKKIFLIVSLLYIIHVVVPIVPDVLNIPVWIVSLGTFVILLILYPRAFLNNSVKWFIGYTLILGFYLLIEKPLTIGIGSVADTQKLIIEMAFILPGLSIFSILFYLRDGTLFKYMSIAALVSLVISFIYLTPLILSDSNVLRNAASADHLNFKIPGIPNYALMHSYIIIFPAILYGIKILKGRQKLLMLGIAGLFVFIIINTYITTSLLISFAVVVFALLYDVKRRLKSFLLISFVAFAVIILEMSGAFLHMFDTLIDYFYGTQVQAKMEDFRTLYITKDLKNTITIAGRTDLHVLSWDAFTENILTGSNPVGGHSSLIDRLGGLGLLGFIPFLMIIVSYARLIYRALIDIEQKTYFVLGLACTLMLLYQKGLFSQEGWLFLMVLMPGLIITFRNSQKNQSSGRT